MSNDLPQLAQYRFHALPSTVGCRRAFAPLYGLTPPKLEHGTLPSFSEQGSGLQTPPVEDMSTTYHPAMASAYEPSAVSAYSASMAHSARSKAAMIEGAGVQYPRYSQQQPATYVNQRYNPVPAASHSGASTQSSRPMTPRADSTMSHKDKVSGGGPAESLIYHSLVIPRCISPNGGNLAEFAAQMTCLFWFETMDDLNEAETIRLRPSNAPIPRLPMLAKPFDQFRKWVYNVLSTTQVTQNVILLALLFIYRLRKSTPQIKGRAGSEYRLLTVALMLGNKFLDDNTYTNKTWAEVSSFAVTEIHVMEVEFLSNMRYNLLTSAAEWQTWLSKLSCFHEYYERALRLPPTPNTMPNTLGKLSVSPLPSPTSNPHVDAGEFLNNNYSPSSSQGHAWAAYQSNMVSPLAGKPSLTLPSSRKRVHEDDQVEHPAKRPVPSRLAQIPNDDVPSRQHSAPADSARLPVPHLTLVTNAPPQHQQHAVSGYTNQAGAYPTHNHASATSQPHVSLPPLQGGMRAMATVYQPTPPASMVPQAATGPVPSSAPPQPMTTGPFAAPTLASHQHYGTPTKRHSPGSLGPFASSPMAEPFGPTSNVHTPLAHTPLANSPSVYLQHRNSPYKPIRHVNTLLYPPPTASLEQYHLPVPLQPSQMHYQPLGRRNDLRSGVVPEYVLYDRQQAYPQVHQQQPMAQQQFQQQQQSRPHGMQHGLQQYQS